MMGIEALPALVQAITPGAHPAGVLGVIFLALGFTVWRTIRSFRREDADDYTRRMSLLDARADRDYARTKTELDRMAARCDDHAARLEVVEALLRDAMRANHVMRADRDGLRHRVTNMSRQLSEPPPVWPADTVA